MKHKITLDLPTPTQFVASLTEREQHPALATAEKAAASAEESLTAARRRVTDLSTSVVALPEQVRKGTATEAELQEAMASLAPARAMAASREKGLQEARQVLEQERQRARAALEAAVRVRHATLLTAIAEVAPVLEEFRVLDLALSLTTDPRGLGFQGTVWPTPLSFDAAGGNRASLQATFDRLAAARR